MEDEDTSRRTKDVGVPSIRCPMLTSSNYTVWAIRMKAMLNVSESWESIDPGVDDRKKNNVAIALLFQSIPESLILQVGEHTTAKGIWEAIKSRHQGADRVKKARLQTLMAELDRLVMNDGDTVDDYAGKISGIAAQSASLGETIKESKLVKKFLHGLPESKFIHIVASLEQVLDLDTTAFEDIVGRIKAYDERVKRRTNNDDQGKLLFANSEQNRGGYGNSQGSETEYGSETGSYGRGGGNYRGRGQGRGRGRGRFNGQYQRKDTSENHDKEKKDLSKIQCWRCDKFGHYVNNCPSRPREQESNLYETQEADSLFMHEVMVLNEEKVFPKELEAIKGDACEWYLDNGASNHMTGNKDFFSTLDERVKGKVRFGDGSHVNIMGKGSICFIDESGRSDVLDDIYFIPDLRHNIISLGQATENGCEVKMKGAILELKDPHGRKLACVTRFPNRLYKTPMRISYPKCFQIQEEDTTSNWHTRLGHVSYGVMKSMTDKEMMNNEHEKVTFNHGQDYETKGSKLQGNEELDWNARSKMPPEIHVGIKGENVG